MAAMKNPSMLRIQYSNLDHVEQCLDQTETAVFTLSLNIFRKIISPELVEADRKQSNLYKTAPFETI